MALLLIYYLGVAASKKYSEDKLFYIVRINISSAALSNIFIQTR